MRLLPYAGILLAHRLRRWTNITPALGQHFVFGVSFAEDESQSRDCYPMLVYCWPTVCDAVPTVYHLCANVSWLLVSLAECEVYIRDGKWGLTTACEWLPRPGSNMNHSDPDQSDTDEGGRQLIDFVWCARIIIALMDNNVNECRHVARLHQRFRRDHLVMT